MGLRSWVLGVAAVAAMGAGVVGTQFRHVDIVVQGPTGKRDFSLWTFRQKVKGILAQAGIKAGIHDQILPASGTIGAAHTIVVREAIPVWVKTAHRRLQVWTTHYGVQAVLDAAKIRLEPMDVVRPSLNTKLSQAATINVIRRWLVTKHITKAVPFAVEHRPDSQLAKGRSQIAVKGRPGKLVKTVHILMQNGKAVRTTTVKTQEVIPPKAEVIDYGTANPISRGGTVPQFSGSVSMLSTAYWPDPSWSNGYTASGLKAQYGVVAVDPRVIPLGTHLYIPGYGFAIAADTGSAIVGDRIDLCYDTAAQADAWGVRPVTVYILASS